MDTTKNIEEQEIQRTTSKGKNLKIGDWVKVLTDTHHKLIPKGTITKVTKVHSPFYFDIECGIFVVFVRHNEIKPIKTYSWMKYA